LGGPTLAEAQKKKKRFAAFMKAFAIVLFLGFTVLVYGYFAFEFQRLQGLGVRPIEDWRSYISFLLSKIPYVNRYVKYEPLQMLYPSQYFERMASATTQRVQQLLQQLNQEREQLERERQQLEAQRRLVLEMRKTWEDKNLQLEAALKRIQVPEDVEKVSQTIASADPAAIASVLASEKYSVESIAMALSKLDATTRADVISELGKLNPNKAAEVMNNIASFELVSKNLSELHKQLEERQRYINSQLSSLIEANVVQTLSVEFLRQMSDEEILNMIDSLSLDENAVLVLFSKLQSERTKEIMKKLKDRNERLFQKLVLRGVSL
jgi:flagellar motility protein MotE (MotC chaperone)